ncbi:RICIN domain-containing protein [Paenibacillus oleatilyticus]|uniref:RICIN domain-containing protein n=1 Tax=Paenibacillus oleatilyticus TaxID=2594886 RepID=A0ABV4UU00_9BACL
MLKSLKSHKNWVIALGISFCFVLLAIVGTGAKSAEAAVDIDPSAIYNIIAKHSGKALDVRNGSSDDGAAIQTWTYNNRGNQQWRIVPTGDGFYKIVAVHSGKVLDVADNSYANGAYINQWSDNGGNNQRWSIEPLGDGSYKITAKHSGKVLDVKNGRTEDPAFLHQWPFQNTDNQKWFLQRAN